VVKRVTRPVQPLVVERAPKIYYAREVSGGVSEFREIEQDASKPCFIPRNTAETV
jgi:hypothetical protein